MNNRVKKAFESAGACSFADRLIYAVLGAVLMAMILSMCGCGYPKKAASKDLLKVSANYPAIIAEHCGRVYPVRVRDSITTKYIPGEVVKVPGPTVFVDCDSAVKEAQKTGSTAHAVAVQTYVGKQVDTMLNTWHQVAENTAAIAAAQAETQGVRDQCDRDKAKLQKDLTGARSNATRWEGGRNSWRLAFLILLGLNIAFFFLRKYIPFL